MTYLYETHLHTREGSSCGVSRGREYIKRYQDLGYTGIIITDHFFNGNCAAARNLSWANWVNESCRGYEHALEEGARCGLDVFFGWEESFDGDDYLVYGLDKEWLLEHPEVRYWTLDEQFNEVKRYGACVVQAHPFRFTRNFRYISHSALYMDAVEAANSGNEQISDALAWEYSKKMNVTATAGSDIHFAGDIRPDTVFGVYLDKKMENIGDYVKAIKNNAISALKTPAGRFDLCNDYMDKIKNRYL